MGVALLLDMTDQQVQAVLRWVESHALITLLAMAPPEVLARTLKVLPNRAARLVADDVSQRGEVTPEEWRQAEQLFAEGVRQAVVEGDLQGVEVTISS